MIRKIDPRWLRYGRPSFKCYQTTTPVRTLRIADPDFPGGSSYFVAPATTMENLEPPSLPSIWTSVCPTQIFKAKHDSPYLWSSQFQTVWTPLWTCHALLESARQAFPYEILKFAILVSQKPHACTHTPVESLANPVPPESLHRSLQIGLLLVLGPLSILLLETTCMAYPSHRNPFCSTRASSQILPLEPPKELYYYASWYPYTKYYS